MTQKQSQILIFGAGNIGRGLMGQLAASAGWNPVFVEACEPFRRELAKAAKYGVRLVGRDPQSYLVDRFEVLSPQDRSQIAQTVAQCRFAVASVGGQHLSAVAAMLVKGLVQRSEPLNILLCENWPKADEVMNQAMIREGGPERVLCETCNFNENDRAMNLSLEAYNAYL